MMRFSTARALFEEFPTLAKAVAMEPTDEDPRAFVRGLVTQGKLREAAAVCAYLLPKREAVWWACRCIRSRQRLVPQADRALPLAEAWVREPEEDNRKEAALYAAAADQQAPATWCAYAAGFTSGNLAVMPDGPVRTPPYLTAESARVALLLSECVLEPEEVKRLLREAVDVALKWLESSASPIAD